MGGQTCCQGPENYRQRLLRRRQRLLISLSKQKEGSHMTCMVHAMHFTSRQHKKQLVVMDRLMHELDDMQKK